MDDDMFMSCHIQKKVYSAEDQCYLASVMHWRRFDICRRLEDVFADIENRVLKPVLYR